ncbi:MAG TPA: sigma-70 family RNA polymerase sigma factor [Acidiferrobacteraceae bacterium]|nr:sigma-70 family RNA polymerase sigma factor [Acidiferrobacteraceae bacterium]
MNLLNLVCRSQELTKKLETSRPRLYRMAYAWTCNAALADDLAQETLVKALSKASQLRDPQAMNAWLFRILSNCWRDYLRKHKEAEDIENVSVLSETTPESSHEEQQLIQKVRDAIINLSEGQRRVVTLVDLEGFTYSEVSHILEIPVGTVMSRLCRAHNTLRDRLLRGMEFNTATKRPARFRRVK